MPSLHELKSRPSLTSLLHKACEEGNLDTLRAILKKPGYFDINARDGGGSTPLHVAVRANHPNVVRFLIKKGVHMEIGDDLNETPLEVALARGFEDIREILFGDGKVGLRINTLPALLRARHENCNPDFFALLSRQSPLYRTSVVYSNRFRGITHENLPLRRWEDKQWDSRSIYLLKYVNYNLS